MNSPVRKELQEACAASGARLVAVGYAAAAALVIAGVYLFIAGRTAEQAGSSGGGGTLGALACILAAVVVAFTLQTIGRIAELVGYAPALSDARKDDPDGDYAGDWYAH